MARHNTDLVRDLDGALDRDLDLARDLARDLVRTLDLARDLDRDCILDHTLDGALALENALTLALHDARARDLARGLVRILTLARDLENDLENDLDSVPHGDLVDNLEDCRAQIWQIMESVEQKQILVTQVLRQSVVDGGEVRVRVPWEVAVRVTRWLVRVLPAADRATYREIYGSELFELAQSGRPRRAQLGYTLHCLVGVVSLRRALRMPAPAPRRQRR